MLPLWFSSMALDLHFTLRCGEHIRSCERSALLRALHARFPGAGAAALAGAAESAAVALLPAALLQDFDAGASAAVAFLFACLHAEAVLANDRFLGRRAQDPGSATP